MGLAFKEAEAFQTDPLRPGLWGAAGRSAWGAAGARRPAVRGACAGVLPSTGCAGMKAGEADAPTPHALLRRIRGPRPRLQRRTAASPERP